MLRHICTISRETHRKEEVHFGVHPVAGRMPGQLNVLLAEAGVPYENVLEMDEVNEQMDEYDVTLVVNTNDTVNSLAEEDDGGGLSGMPVIKVWNSSQVIFVKRTMASGYSGAQTQCFTKTIRECC